MQSAGAANALRGAEAWALDRHEGFRLGGLTLGVQGLGFRILGFRVLGFSVFGPVFLG